MSDTVIVAIISAGSTMLTAITALLLNYRGFSSLERRMDSLVRNTLPLSDERLRRDRQDYPPMARPLPPAPKPPEQ